MFSQDKFYSYHPGSDIAERLRVEKDYHINNLVLDPKKGVDLIQERFCFGKKTDFWDDYVFTQLFIPALDRIIKLPLEQAINIYSILDHLLFLPYIRRDEDPLRFRRAFWNVNGYGIYLAKRLDKEILKGNHSSGTPSSKVSTKKICFVFKGVFKLAHSEFLNEFLVGASLFVKDVQITLLLIDDSLKNLNHKNLEHVKKVSLSGNSSSFSKLVSYRQYVENNKFDHICWVACVQNLCLYMGSKCAPTQSYWSMKYHSIIMESLDKYAGLGFGGKTFIFDDIEWYRGRAFPSLSLPSVSNEVMNADLISANIPINGFKIGCFVRSEKLNNINFWLLIEMILKSSPHIHFLLASQVIPEVGKEFISTDLFKKQFHHLGWVDTKKWCQYLDLYVDSYPRGSCLTILEAIKAKVPVFMFDSEHNRESSALPYLSSVHEKESLPPGVLKIESIDLLFNLIIESIKEKNKLLKIIDAQQVLLKKLEGKNVLFAKDYLNFFLDLNLTIKGASNRL